jgi:hypothetical protein
MALPQIKAAETSFNVLSETHICLSSGGHLEKWCSPRSRLLGHKTSLMTQRYAHHSPESLRDGVNVLDKPQLQRVSKI